MFVSFIIILIFIAIIRLIINLPIKNIIIKDNIYLTDEEIIETAKIENYPSFVKTFSYRIKKRLKRINLVKNVKVTKRLNRTIEITIEEYKILYLVRSTGLYTLEDARTLDIERNLYGIPTLINYVPEEIEEKLIKKLATVDYDVLDKISEIEYSPTSYDDERFILYMNDENLVYITLSKIDEFKKYISIKTQLEGKKGILYLDSGNYFEIKK